MILLNNENNFKNADLPPKKSTICGQDFYLQFSAIASTVKSWTKAVKTVKTLIDVRTMFK